MLLGAGCGPVDGDPVEGLDGAVHRVRDLGGVRWHWVEVGSGPPLVLLHGMPETWHGWAAVVPALAERHRVLALDLPGFGATSAGEGELSFAAVGGAVGDWIAALELENVALAGHDWGGLVGVHVAAGSERVAAYAHVAAPIDRYDLTRLPDYRDFWLDPSEAPRFLRIADVVVPRIYDLGWRGGHERMDPALLERRIADFGQRGVRGAVARWFAGLELARDWTLIGDSAPPWDAVEVPVLLVIGDRDLQVTLEGTLAIEDALPAGSRVAVVDDSGHYPAAEQPTVLTALLETFFGGAR